MRAQKSRDFSFTKRASVYDDGFEGRFSWRFYNLLLREVELSPGAKVLDFGCGTGALLKKLSNTCEIVGFGIDADENMIAEAQKKCPQMDFQRSRCEQTPFPDRSFDIAIACMAYHHFGDKEGFAREASRILKPGGCLYIVDPRFPALLRKTINRIARRAHVTGEFFAPEDIAPRFSGFGFEWVGASFDGYAQVVKLKAKK